MGVQILRTTILALAFAGAAAMTSTVHPAKPAGKGGGGDTTPSSSSSSAPPEFYRVEINPQTRNLLLHGIHFIGEDSQTPPQPVYPTTVAVGGKTVVIDTVSSLAATNFTTGEGALVVPFASLLDALGQGDPLILLGRKSFEIKVVTAGGTAAFSAYVTRDIKDVPLDTGSCPCTFTAYNPVEAAPGTKFCSSTQGISTDEYIEAGYGKVDEISGTATAVIIGSHTSWSREPLYASSCYVRGLSTIVNGVETPQYLEGPIPVGNVDHSLCVTKIQELPQDCGP